jgi:methylenetetrahydrofolate reductase (NADPH)
MKADSKFAQKIGAGDFLITVEHAPTVTADPGVSEAALKTLGSKPVVVNIADNQHGIAMSSVAAAAAAVRCGVEPVLQMVTRDRNRIALQSDLLGAASLGIKNVLCLSGYHQTLIGCSESANVFDVDSTQFIEMANRMSDPGLLADGTKINGPFSMLVGAVANPFLKPLELNLIRLRRKIEAGARFIQTHAVFDLEAFSQWLKAIKEEGLTQQTAVLASVFPLASAEEALRLRSTFADFHVPDAVIDRLKNSGGAEAQAKTGIAICVETIKTLKTLGGLRGIHLLSGSKESLVPEILSAAGL